MEFAAGLALGLVFGLAFKCRRRRPKPCVRAHLDDPCVCMGAAHEHGCWKTGKTR